MEQRFSVSVALLVSIFMILSFVAPVLAQYKCSECGEEFSTQEELDDHMKSVHGPPPDHCVCPLCDAVFDTPEELEAHLRSVHPELPVYILPIYFCPFCDREFSTMSEIEAHMRSVHPGQFMEPTEFICPFCGAHFTTRYEFGSHMQSAHPEMAPPPGGYWAPPPGPMKYYFCPLCGSMFSTSKEIDVHIAASHPGQRIEHPCPFCGVQFTAFSEMDAHIESVHAREIPTFIENFVPPDRWMPPEDDWGIWMPHEDYMPPPDWRPEMDWRPPDDWWGPEMVPFEGWMPPPIWVPPPRFMQNVVPPWMPIDAFSRPEHWMPRKDWVPRDQWRPAGFLHVYHCHFCSMEFETAAELDAHHASAHPDIPGPHYLHPCPFCGEVFSTCVGMESHVELSHAGQRPTFDQIPKHFDLFMPRDLLRPPEGWEDFVLPLLDDIPFFVPPWLNPEENHWIPPEKRPFWTWEVDNIRPGDPIYLHIENAPWVIPETGARWIQDPSALENLGVLVGGIRIYTENIPDIMLENIITTVQNLDNMPADIPVAPGEDHCEFFQIGTNIPEYIDNAEIGFKVDKDWIAANNIDNTTLRLEHYVEDTGEWVEMTPTMVGSDENYIYYNVENVPSFSVFAVTGESIGVVTEVTPPAAAEISTVAIAAVGVGVLVAVLVVIVWLRRRTGQISPSMKRLETSLRE